MTTRVRIDGTFENGDSYKRIAEVSDPEGPEQYQLDAWFEAVVWDELDAAPHHVGYHHEALVLSSPVRQILGAKHEWSGR